MVRFSKANTKVRKLYKVRALQKYLTGKRKIYSFDMLAGHFCPFAHNCLSKVVTKDGNLRIQDGKHTEFRCYAASLEVLFKNTYNLHKHNSDIMRSAKNKYAELIQALPDNLGILRLHSSGDFFNQSYFDAWLRIAKENPDRLFYAYTKSLPFWVARLEDIPHNFVLTASYGGRRDDLISEYQLRYAKVVYSKQEAKQLKLELDDNDSHAANPNAKSFALLIHGVQPKK